MGVENPLSCVVSGSYRKYKPEIDRTIDEFRDLGVKVLAPEKGWILRPNWRVLLPDEKELRRLPTEVDMSPKAIEDRYFYYLANSRFLYVNDCEAYAGDTVSFEIGFALAHDIPVFSRYPISLNIDPDFTVKYLNYIMPLSPKGVIDFFKGGEEPKSIYLKIYTPNLFAIK